MSRAHTHNHNFIQWQRNKFNWLREKLFTIQADDDNRLSVNFILKCKANIDVQDAGKTHLTADGNMKEGAFGHFEVKIMTVSKFTSCRSCIVCMHWTNTSWRMRPTPHFLVYLSRCSACEWLNIWRYLWDSSNIFIVVN